MHKLIYKGMELQEFFFACLRCLGFLSLKEKADIPVGLKTQLKRDEQTEFADQSAFLRLL